LREKLVVVNIVVVVVVERIRTNFAPAEGRKRRRKRGRK